MHEMLEFLNGAPYAVCVELKNFDIFVFCFGGVLFVSCVAVCGCGDVKNWHGCCWGGGRRMEARLASPQINWVAGPPERRRRWIQFAVPQLWHTNHEQAVSVWC